MIEPDSKEDLMQQGLSEGEALLMIHKHEERLEVELVTADGDDTVAPDAPSLRETVAAAEAAEADTTE